MTGEHGDKPADQGASGPGAMTEEQIMAATVGERQPVNSTIYLAPYDPAWPAIYERLAQRIRAALGNQVLQLEHVGSTSVPGLAAKPVIDMVLAVADSTDEAAYVPPLEALGYVLRIREPDWFEHRLLKAPDVAGNLHVFSAGCEEIDRMVLFRDWLRTHADDRALYEATKRELAARTWKYTQNYADAKSEIVREILARTQRGSWRPAVESKMTTHDDDLTRFAAEGAALPATGDEGGGAPGTVGHDGAAIWYAAYGTGPTVVLLHGGLGHSGNWAYQVPALVASGYRAIVIDSRGHGHSTHDARPYSYDLLASDATAVMDALHIQKAALVGWSDGACAALILADKTPAQAAGVFFFGCNMDASGAIENPQFGPVVDRCFSRHVKDYARLSATPDRFDEFVAAVGLMQRTQPNYTAADLARISVPVTIVQAEHDEFIKREHAEYLARSIPGAEFVELPGVSHLAPLQRPEVFNAALLAFLGKVMRDR